VVCLQPGAKHARRARREDASPVSMRSCSSSRRPRRAWIRTRASAFPRAVCCDARNSGWLTEFPLRGSTKPRRRAQHQVRSAPSVAASAGVGWEIRTRVR